MALILGIVLGLIFGPTIIWALLKIAFDVWLLGYSALLLGSGAAHWTGRGFIRVCQVVATYPLENIFKRSRKDA